MLYGLVWSVIGAVILSVLSDILLAEGETKKYVKGIIAVVAVAVVFSGVAGLLKGGFDINTVFENSDVEIAVDERYVREIENARGEEKKSRFLKALEGDGISGVEVFFVLNTTETSFCFDTVYISTNNVVIADNAANIVVNDRITELARATFKPLSGGLYLDGKFL